jgi:hypothetical protein
MAFLLDVVSEALRSLLLYERRGEKRRKKTARRDYFSQKWAMRSYGSSCSRPIFH